MSTIKNQRYFTEATASARLILATGLFHGEFSLMLTKFFYKHGEYDMAIFKRHSYFLIFLLISHDMQQ